MPFIHTVTYVQCSVFLLHDCNHVNLVSDDDIRLFLEAVLVEIGDHFYFCCDLNGDGFYFLVL